ncbi:MAG: TonB-dependent receptor, partial [Bacteroidetes bacterium]|nr:TonB-dependent receptor [Bacteroidota bacterium]
YFSSTFRDWARVNTINGTALNPILANPSANQTAYQIMTGSADGPIEYQSAARTYQAKGVESQIQYVLNTDNINSKAQLGIRYHKDQADRYATKSTYTMTRGIMVLTVAGIKGNSENQIRKANSLAAFFNYNVNFKGLSITPGIRYEDIYFEFLNYGNADAARLGTALKSATNRMKILLPGVGINYQIDHRMNLYAGAHKGFSPPGMPSLGSSEQARPETAVNYELGFRFEQKGLRLDVAGFHSDYDNILGSDNVSGGGAGTGAMFNAGNALIQGLEFSLACDLRGNNQNNTNWKIPLQISYTFTDARFKDSFRNAGGDWGSGMIYRNDEIPFIPKHALSVNLGFEHKKITATFSARYVGLTRTKPGQGSLITPSEQSTYDAVNSIASFLIVDFSTNYRISKGISCFNTLNNITNNRNIVANLPNGYRPNMPFGIMLGLKADIR